MKYLKTYTLFERVSNETKLFEALVEDITFIRMSHTDMLNGREAGWYQPKQRRMSFVAPINDWFYKGNSIQNSLRSGNELVSDIMKSTFNKIYADSQTGEGVDESLNYLLDFKAIGTGTIEDLKRSPHFGKYNLYVWTTDKVYLKRYVKESEIKEKEPKPYKNQPVLDTEDFTERGIKPEEIGNFYQSEWGRRFKRLQPTADYNLRREEALKLLDEWIKTR